MTRRDAAGLAAVAAVLVVALPGAFRDIGGAMEEGFMLVLPERLLDGDVPNRDFLFLYGPGSLWVLAAAFAVAEPALAVERLVGALQLAGVATGVWALARPWGRGLAVVCGAASAVFAVTPIGVVALPWPGGLALLLWGAVVARRRPFAGGVLLGASLLYRPDLVAAAGLVCLVVRHRRVVAGVAVGAAPMLVHLALAGPARAFEGMVVDPVLRLRAGRSLPVPPSAGTLDGYLQRIAELDVIPFPAPLPVPLQLRVWFLAVVAATAALAAAALVRRRATVLAAVAVGILPQALQRPDSTHLAWVSCVTLALLPVAVADLAPASVGDRTRRAAGAVALGLVALLAFPAFTARPYTELVLQTAGSRRTAIEVEHHGRRFYVGRADVAGAVERLAPVVERTGGPGGRLFVGPVDLRRTPYADSWIYHLFPALEPATRYVEMDPGLSDRPGSGLADDLASADVVVLTPTWDDWVEPNDSVDTGSGEAAAVLARVFCPVAEDEGIAVYGRCG